MGSGMFESRGSIITNKANNRSLHPRCMLVGIDKSIPDCFQENWPGSMKPVSLPKGRLSQWKWVVTGSDATGFLQEVSPFFRTAQALAKTKLALEFQNLKERGGDYASLLTYHQKIGALNAYKRKGVR